MTPPGEIATALRVSVDFWNDGHIDPSTNLYICALHSTLGPRLAGATHHRPAGWVTRHSNAKRDKKDKKRPYQLNKLRIAYYGVIDVGFGGVESSFCSSARSKRKGEQPEPVFRSSARFRSPVLQVMGLAR